MSSGGVRQLSELTRRSVRAGHDQPSPPAVVGDVLEVSSGCLHDVVPESGELVIAHADHWIASNGDRQRPAHSPNVAGDHRVVNWAQPIRLESDFNDAELVTQAWQGIGK